jgi:hypothetical protein
MTHLLGSVVGYAVTVSAFLGTSDHLLRLSHIQPSGGHRPPDGIRKW